LIERLTHHERRWTARLRDGSQQTVAKSHASAALELMAHDSSQDVRISAKCDSVIEAASYFSEI